MATQARATRPKRLTSLTIPGAVRLRKTVGDALQAAVEAQRAAGIMMVVAAHNQGPDCSTVATPGIYEASYTVGALVTGTDTIASFSSRGPVTADGSNRIKPDITAPGTAIARLPMPRDNSYAFFSGTSMATPHIAGAMALLWSAIPSLQNQIDASRAVLNNVAVHIASTQCGDAGPPNNVYGWGRVDILAAVTGITPTPTPCRQQPHAEDPPGCSGHLCLTAPPVILPPAMAPLSMPEAASGTFTVHNDLMRYDPVADSWTSLAPSPDYYFAAPASVL